MKVRELREAMEDLDDDAEVRIAEFGYRSSGQMNVAEAVVFEDRRAYDDWGNAREGFNEDDAENENDDEDEALLPKGKGTMVLFLVEDGACDNRYPPSGLRDEGGAW